MITVGWKNGVIVAIFHIVRVLLPSHVFLSDSHFRSSMQVYEYREIVDKYGNENEIKWEKTNFIV